MRSIICSISPETRISAGFPSPAEDFMDKKLDLNTTLIKNPISTYFMRISGESMTGAGIFDGDLIVVDRSISARSGHIIVAALDGDLAVKRLRKTSNKIELHSENILFSKITVLPDQDFYVWGVVTFVVHEISK